MTLFSSHRSQAWFLKTPLAFWLCMVSAIVWLGWPIDRPFAQQQPAATSAPAAQQPDMIRQIDQLLREIGQQQVILAQKQVELDERLTLAEESLRQAKIFASRGGSR